jgi:GNAT superfamily N-acetyltransferase
MTEAQRPPITPVDIEVRDPHHPDVDRCLRTYFAELADRYGGFDPGLSRPLTPEQMIPPAGLLLMAYLDGEPVGCGALRFLPDSAATIKRMWVAPTARGIGLGRRILAELEDRARANGVRLLRLETKNELYEAIQMYTSFGYREVEPFNDEFYADHWYEKSLTGD